MTSDKKPGVLNKLVLFAGLLTIQMVASGNEPGYINRNNQMIDRAISQAKTAKENTAKQPAPLLNYQELRSKKGIDLDKIASQYQNNLQNKLTPSETKLYIFISTSMPEAALRRIGQQANEVGAVLILRGMRGKLGTKGVLEATIDAIKPAAETGVAINIDPEAFRRFNVKSVPTFVLTDIEEGNCGKEQCEKEFVSVVGDVSVEYALNELAKEGVNAEAKAEVFLARIKKRTQ